MEISTKLAEPFALNCNSCSSLAGVSSRSHREWWSWSVWIKGVPLDFLWARHGEELSSNKSREPSILPYYIRKMIPRVLLVDVLKTPDHWPEPVLLWRPARSEEREYLFRAEKDDMMTDNHHKQRSLSVWCASDFLSEIWDYLHRMDDNPLNVCAGEDWKG